MDRKYPACQFWLEAIVSIAMIAPFESTLRRVIIALTTTTVILAPILSFSVQPITGKFLLPLLGGTATTWLSSLIFFQSCVLIGYLAAFAVSRLSAPFQVGIVSITAAASAFMIHLPPLIPVGTASVTGLLQGLSLSLLLPVSFLFMVGIILHEWLGVYRGSIPWYLYALSNLGSILALITYPFIIEPAFDLSLQSTVWHVLFVLLVLLVLALSYFRLQLSSKKFAAREDVVPDSSLIARWGPLIWFILAFLSCLLFMASTRELTAELGSHPLAWVIPLALYLGSFSLTFSGFWSPLLNRLCGVLFSVAFTGYIFKQGLSVTGMDALSIFLLLLSTGSGCAFLNGILYRYRSQRAYATVYIMIALGGCLAGLFSTIAAPFIFERNYELYLAALIGIGLAGFAIIPRRPLMQVACCGLFLLPALWFLNKDLDAIQPREGKRNLTFLRTIYSQNILSVQPGRIAIMSEATLHGSEIIVPGFERMPTTYYYENSPVGMLFEYLRTHDSAHAVDVGVVGLGAGTIAHYARKGDRFTFWDIDPAMLDIAQEFFSFIERSEAEVELILADGRLGTRRLDNALDILIIDAFTGDSVPTHLLTVEAYQEFAEAAAGGWLVFHISSRWIDLSPVLQASMERAADDGVRILTIVPEEDSRKKDFRSAHYIIVPPDEHYRSFLDFLRPKADSNPYVREMHRIPSDRRDSILWTDDRHSVTQLLEWSKFF